MTATPEKIARAIKYAAFAKKPITLENVNRYLNDGDHITAEQLEAHHATAAQMMPPKPVFAPAQDLAAAAADDEGVTQVVPDPSPALVEEGDRLRPVTVAEAQRALNSSQNCYRAANDAVREKRAKLGVALHRWLQLTDQASPTFDENVREFIRQSNIERGLRATGQLPQRQRGGGHGPSVIDQVAAGTRGATYSNRSGAFAFKRGATSLAQSEARRQRIAAEREIAAADPGGYPANALRRG